MRHAIGGQIPQPVFAVGLLCGDVENIFLAAGELALRLYLGRDALAGIVRLSGIIVVAFARRQNFFLQKAY